MAATSQNFYCPSCGKLIEEAYECPGVKAASSYVMLTCHTPGCKLIGATTTDKALIADDWLNRWHVARAFDLTTGEKLK